MFSLGPKLQDPGLPRGQGPSPPRSLTPCPRPPPCPALTPCSPRAWTLWCRSRASPLPLTPPCSCRAPRTQCSLCRPQAPGLSWGCCPPSWGLRGLYWSVTDCHTPACRTPVVAQRVSCVACDTLCCVSAYCHLQTNLTCSLLDTNTSTRIYRHPGSLKMINFVVDNVYGFSFFMWFSYSHSHWLKHKSDTAC